MPDEAKPSLFQQVKARLQLSLAATASVVVGGVLIVLAVFAWLVYAADPTRIAWGDYMSVGRVVGLVVLWALSVAITYLTVRVWMNDVPLGSPGVTEAWNAGTKLLARHGVRFTDLPCFVVLGCTTRHQQEQWFGSEGVTPPDAATGLDWHVNQDRILIFCRDTGVYDNLLRSLNSATDAKKENAVKSFGQAPSFSDLRPASDGDFSETASEAASVASSPAASSSNAPVPNPPASTATDESVSSPDPQSGTQGQGSREAEPIASISDAPTAVALAQPKSSSSSSGAREAADSPAFASAMKTLDHVSALVQHAQSFADPVSTEFPAPVPLSSLETTAAQESLSTLCMKLRAARFPHSPVNGILVFVDSQTLGGLPDAPSVQDNTGRILGRAIRSDAEQLQRELGVVSPMTMVIAENRQPDDYIELCRRLRMAEPDHWKPLGKASESEQIPTTESMNQLADGAIDEVESRIQRIFRMPRSLTQPQNHRLVRMLIRCRRWRASLRTLAVESCAWAGKDSISADGQVFTSASGTDTSEPGIVSGLFVASPTQSKIAAPYVNSVLDRMIGQQNHLAWTSGERRRWAHHRRVIQGLIAVTFLLAALMLYQLWAVFSG